MSGFRYMRNEAINNVNEDTAFGFNTFPVNMSTEEPSNNESDFSGNESDYDCNGFNDYNNLFNYYGSDL